MTTLRSSPLRAMDKQEALRVLARDLNTSFAAMYAKFEGSSEEGGGDNVLQIDGENLQLSGEDLTLGT